MAGSGCRGSTSEPSSSVKGPVCLLRREPPKPWVVVAPTSKQHPAKKKYTSLPAGQSDPYNNVSTPNAVQISLMVDFVPEKNMFLSLVLRSPVLFCQCTMIDWSVSACFFRRTLRVAGGKLTWIGYPASTLLQAVKIPQGQPRPVPMQ